MFRFVDALEIESDIQLKIESKEYESALQLYMTAKEKADIVLSNPAFLQWVSVFIRQSSMWSWLFAVKRAIWICACLACFFSFSTEFW